MHSGTNKKLNDIYDKFSNSTKPAERIYVESMRALVNLAESKDPYTKRHSVKVSNLAAALAKLAGLPKKDIENIRFAAILHDIGKIGIKSKILLKKSSLDDDEYDEIKKHPDLGVEIIKPLKFYREIVSMIKHHHENYDGTGYPAGLKENDIPLGARILAVADVYVALTSKRAYRSPYTPKKAIEIIEEESGKKFAPDIVKKLKKALGQE